MQNSLCKLLSDPNYLKAAEIISRAEKEGMRLGFYNDDNTE